MSASTEPNPPARREEDFPKTNTIPDGWILDSLMDVYNSKGSVYDPAAQMEVEAEPAPVTMTGSSPTHNRHANGRANGKTHSGEPVEAPSAARTENENLFTRRLEPFPSVYDMVGMYL